MKFTLARSVPEPSLKEVHAELRLEIQAHGESNREADGKVHDSTALQAIACFQKALSLLPRRETTKSTLRNRARTSLRHRGGPKHRGKAR